MSTNIKQLTPGLAIHPGELLKDELEARELSQQEFANLLGMKRSQLNEIIKGKRNLNAELALLLGEALEMDADYWLSLQKNYELDQARIDAKTRQKMADIELWNRVVKPNFAISYLKKQGFISGNPSDDIPQIKNIYGLTSFDNLGNLYANRYAHYRKSEKHETDQVNLLGWAKLVSYKADSQAVPRFDHSQQPEVLNALKAAINRNTNLIKETEALLHDAGIKLIIQEKAEKAPVDGVAFWSNGNPAIGLSLRHKRIDNFAFTLFHELGHVYLHLVNNNQASFIDNLDENKGENIEEKEADEFAHNQLIDPEIWERCKDDMVFNDGFIKKFSQSIQVHPAIVRGRMSYESGYYKRDTDIDYSIR